MYIKTTWNIISKRISKIESIILNELLLTDNYFHDSIECFYPLKGSYDEFYGIYKNSSVNKFIFWSMQNRWYIKLVTNALT